MPSEAELISDGVGAASLTAQERRVAGLVASGLTSRQVAVRLLCSPRTVDNHVAHILRKLGLPSRHDLAFHLNSSVGRGGASTAPPPRTRLFPVAARGPGHRPTRQGATMMATETTVHLGRMPGTSNADSVPRHRLLYLPDEAMVVLPTCRAGTDQWHCMVVATRAARREGHVLLAETTLADACTTIRVEPERDPDGFAQLLWPTRAFQ